MNVQAVICAIEVLRSGPSIGAGTGPWYRAAGYALSGGGRRIERVEVSGDGGVTWVTAEIDRGATGTDLSGEVAFGWVLWSAAVQVPLSSKGHLDSLVRRELVVRAWDSAANTQPEAMSSIWNLRGVLGNSWHRASAPEQSRL